MDSIIIVNMFQSIQDHYQVVFFVVFV